MKTIWKFPLEGARLQKVIMPKDAEILSAQLQHDSLYMWARVEISDEHEVREIATYGTGHEMIDAPQRFIDTFQVSNGRLVFHVFEIIKEVAA